MRARQTGMSLVELMVALALGLLLLLGVVNALLAGRASGQVEASLARLQENGRIALELLAADIRGARYVGCNPAGVVPTVMAGATAWTGLAGYERGESSWSPPLPAHLGSLRNRARAGNDVLNLQGGVPSGIALTADVAPASTALAVDGNPGCIRRNDRVLIADCARAYLFRVTNQPRCGGAATRLAYAAGGNSPATMQPGFASGEHHQIMEFLDRAWYVADSGRRGALGAPVHSLYRLTNGRSEEVVEGVEGMQALYGERLASGNTRYRPAADPALDMGRVASIRVALLIQSLEPVLDSADRSRYQVLDETIASAGTTARHSGDRALRRVFGTTVALRNR